MIARCATEKSSFVERGNKQFYVIVKKGRNRNLTKKSKGQSDKKTKIEHIGSWTKWGGRIKKMDHLVLIPQDFNLVVTSENSPQDNVTVWSNQRIAQGTIYYPFQGTVRFDKLSVFSTASSDDVSEDSYSPPPWERNYANWDGNYEIQLLLRNFSF